LISSDAKRKAEEMKGELYNKFPQLYELEMAKIKVAALSSATIYITPQQQSGSNSNFFNSPIAFLGALKAQNNTVTGNNT